MKLHHLLMACAACLILPASAQDRKKEETPLGRQMEQIGRAIKGFRKETDPAKCAALAREAQQAVARSLQELPETVGKMPDGPDKAKAGAEYRKMMGRVYVSLCELEEAYLAGNADAAATILGSLKELKKSGHDKFMEEE